MIEQSNLPSYLTCPYCPAQSMLTRSSFLKEGRGPQGISLQYKMYVCPANHKFWVENNVLPMRMQERRNPEETRNSESTTTRYGRRKEDK